MKLTERERQQRAGASGNFVNLPDAGWVHLDQKAVQDAQEAMADLGVDGLSALEQKIGIEQAAHLDEDGLAKFVPSAELEQLRGRLDEFEGIESTELPDGLCAEMGGWNPSRRHGPGQDVADARLAEVAKDKSPEECQDQADSGCLPGLGPAQLAS